MHPALLNSIYQFSEKKITNFQDLVEIYLNNLFVLFLNVLEDHNISNLNERIKVKKMLPSGRKFIDTHDAGWYFVNLMLESSQYKEKIKELDNMFLEHCDKENKEECLEMIKHVFMEMASESLDKNKIIETIQKLDFSHKNNEYA
jgi:uncharacterized protein YerC